MKNFLPLVLVLLFFTTSLSAQVAFYKLFQNGEEHSQVSDVVSLLDGTFAMIGISDIPNASSQVTLTKVDCRGEVEWAKSLGPTSTIGNVFSTLTQADNGDLIFVNNVGSFQNYDILAGRVELNGNVIWKNRYGGNRDDTGNGVLQTSDGNIVIVGATNSWGSDSNGSVSYTDFYLMKIDGADGNVLWSKTFGNNQSIETGYAVVEDESNNLFLTGRFLVGGTFYACILKTDSDGNVLLFKGYGAPNHRTYCYDIMVTPEGDIAITGSTTIAKEDHLSYSDVFLIKTDSAGVPYFTNIYYPFVGTDRSESGSSLVLQEDGGFGIGVPTLSFTNWTTGFVPNKNAVFSTDANGMIQKAVLFNQGGSHYTRLRSAPDGGYVLSGFSNFYDANMKFNPLLIKMDSNYEGSCNEIIVTSELSLANEIWDVQDIDYVEGSGHEINAYSFEESFSFSSSDSQCEVIPLAEAGFSVSPNADEPLATFDFTDMSIGVGTYLWDFGDGNISTEQNPVHSYTEVGNYEVCLTLFANCDTSTTCKTIEVTAVPTGVEHLSKDLIEIFPNPLRDVLRIEWGAMAAPEYLSIYDAQGRQLLHKVNLPNSDGYDLVLRDFPKGVYFLQVYFEEGLIGKVVVKE